MELLVIYLDTDMISQTLNGFLKVMKSSRAVIRVTDHEVLDLKDWSPRKTSLLLVAMKA